MKKALFPGSFDPWHTGHEKVLAKARKIFDEVYVVVSINSEKNNRDSLDSRYQKVVAKLKEWEGVKVIKNDGLTANLAVHLQAPFIVRSARNGDEYSKELALAAANHHLNSGLETVLIIPDYDDIAFSSTLLRQKKGFNV